MTELTDLERFFVDTLAAGGDVSDLLPDVDLPGLEPSVTPLDAALYYAGQEIPVFSLQPGSKIPFGGTRGVLDATLDLERIALWWASNPAANVGLATGHRYDVVDIDGEPGHVSRSRLADKFATLDVRGVALTPRPGGMHLYVPARPGAGNRAKMADGVDYRGLGGYVVAPPSVLDDRPEQHAGTYRWLRRIEAP